MKSWQVMGILNVTPDSFFDGGLYGTDLSKTIDRAALMVKHGAAILDIGGESTRPGAEPVSVEQELDRVVPVIKELASRFDITLSVDTTKSKVAHEAVNAGAHWINDVSAGRFDSEMKTVAADLNATVVLMHSRENPETMQNNPNYDNVVNDVVEELLQSVETFICAGVDKQKIILDPGIGFAKSVENNLTLLNNCSSFLETGYPLLIGTSRKSVIGAITGKEADRRLAGSLATIGETYRQGATIFRVHDVEETVDYLKMVDAVIRG